MFTKLFALAVAGTITSASISFAQVRGDGEWCATDRRASAHEPTLAEMNNLALGFCPGGICSNLACDQPGLRNTFIPGGGSPTIVVAVVVHVICSDAGTGCLATTTRIDQQMTQLNADFLSSGIQFQYEIQFNNETDWLSVDNVAEELAMKNAFATTPELRLNIYVCNLNNFLGGALGDGVGPWDPTALAPGGGVMIDPDALAAQPPVISRVLTHEVGHALGLWHTFRGVVEVPQCSICYECTNAFDKDFRGDFCADTPPTPLNTTCNPISGVDNCGNAPWGPTDPTNIMSQGFAVWPSTCIDHFTPQQKGRMRCWFTNALADWEAGPAVIRVPTDQPTIKAAVDAAVVGTTIILEDDVAVFSGTDNRGLTIDKTMTITSEAGAAGCTIDCDNSSWAFRVKNRGAPFTPTEFTLEGVTIREGRAQFGGVNNNGGAVGIFDNGSATIRDCVFTANHALGSGGAISFDGGTSLFVDRCVIQSNVVESFGNGFGGGLFLKPDSSTTEMRVLNSFIVDNTSFNSGGGLHVRDDSGVASMVFELRNCTIAVNDVTNNGAVGGGAFVSESGASPLGAEWTILNCILWDNVVPSGALVQGDQLAFAHTFGTATIDYCDIEGGQADIANLNAAVQWGIGNKDVDPAFSNPGVLNFHLKKFSQCINAGDPAYVPFPGELDIDRTGRILEGRVEIGADERFFGAQQQQL